MFEEVISGSNSVDSDQTALLNELFNLHVHICLNISVSILRVFNPISLRKVKIVFTFVLSESIRVKVGMYTF